MGRRGYVQTRPPEYGSCISDWAQGSLCDCLGDAGIKVCVPCDCEAEYADRWEIMVPEVRTKGGKYRYAYGKILKVAKSLREHPDSLKGDTGEGCYGEEAAALLEEGVAAAKRHRSGCITIDWW